MKKILTTIIAACFALGATTALATSTSNKQSSATSKDAPSFLFVVYSKKGKLQQNKDGKYTLEMRNTDINHIIKFSNRPYRLVRYITVGDLDRIWGTGTNSFADDAPNAVLSASNLRPQIVILNSLQRDKDKLNFNVVPSTNTKIGKLKNITLTIDCTSASPVNC